MKKQILAAVILCATFFFACTKDRTCSCTATKTGTAKTSGKVVMSVGGFPLPLADTTFSQPVLEIRSYDKKLEKVSNRAAKNNCISYSEPYSENTLLSIPSSSFDFVVEAQSSGTIDYSCKLK